MAINDKNQQNDSSMGQAFAAAENQQRGNNGQQGQQQNSFSFRSMGSMMRAPMGRSPASEVLSKMNKALIDMYSQNVNSNLFEITLIPIDMNTNIDLDVSVIVICARDKAALESGVAYHTLLLAASIPVPTSRFEVINDVNTEVVRVIGDAYTDKMAKVVRDTVGRSFPNSKQHSAGSCVVPAEFNISDNDQLYMLASNAVYATCSTLEMIRPDFVDVNLSNAQNDSSLQVRTTFGNHETVDRVGAPTRSDIVIDFFAAAPNQQQNSTGVERVNNVGQITGFVDFVWAPVVAQGNIYLQNQQPMTQKYAPRFVCTKMESADLMTIPAQLLSLLSAFSLNENNSCQWIRQFDRKGFANGVDWQDAGALAIEANIGNDPSGYGVRADVSKTESLYKLMALAVRPTMVLSMDVPECGPETWYNDVFAAAAEGNEKANRAIIQAANYLTNGAFSKYFGGGKVATDELNRIHLGHYLGADGVRHDIRNIDYLAILNMVGDKDIGVVRDWSDTFLKTNYGQKLRLGGRKKIMEQLVSDLRITGFARRVTFEMAFIDALYKGATDAGLVIRNTTTVTELGGFDRATGDFLSSAFMSGGNSGLFNRGGSFNTNNASFNRSFSGRWN